MDQKPRAPEQQKKLPPQVEQMLASAKEMEAVLTNKLTKIDAVSQEKSEMAKQVQISSVKHKHSKCSGILDAL